LFRLQNFPHAAAIHYDLLAVTKMVDSGMGSAESTRHLQFQVDERSSGGPDKADDMGGTYRQARVAIPGTISSPGTSL
jgi:hypothetical protein